jgi:hypothetical protein
MTNLFCLGKTIDTNLFCLGKTTDTNLFRLDKTRKSNTSDVLEKRSWRIDVATANAGIGSVSGLGFWAFDLRQAMLCRSQ